MSARKLAPLIWALTTLLFLVPELALAAKLRTEVAARRVGVGQGFEVKLSATQEDGDAEPQNPQLTVRGQAEVRGPSVGTQRTMTMRNFSVNSESSVTATWVVTPTATGKLVIGPGTFQVGGTTIRGETVVVEVVAEPQAVGRRDPFGRRGSIFGPDPSDIFGDDPFDLFSRRMGQASIPQAPEEYRVETAPDRIAFLRILVDKKKVLLGEPVRLTVLAYGSRGGFQEVSPNEPSLPDFLSYSVLESSHDEPTFRTAIDGQQFLVRKLREYILIPLKTGTLRIGGMTAVLQGNRGSYPLQGSPLGLKLTSPDLDLSVANSPEADKPAGYFPGDVGAYQLIADVQPRTLGHGEYAEVVIQIKGRGQIPTRVLLPEGKDLVWEPPTMTGGPEIQDGELRGTRVLKYALQVKGAGTLSLGEAKLPHYDHFKQRYRTARVDLGNITVEPPKGGADPNHIQKENEPVAKDPIDQRIPLAPRAAPYDSPARRLPTPPSSLWWVFLLTPSLVGAGASVRSLLRRRARSPKSRDKSQAGHHLEEAKRALGNQEPAEAAKKLERALYEALDRAAGIKTRGFLREHLSAELRRRGFTEAIAQESRQLLIDLEQSRYDAGRTVDSQLYERAARLVSTLSKLEKALEKKRANEGNPV